jgi:adenosine deaminase
MMLNGIDGCWADADRKAAWREQWPGAFDALVDNTAWPPPASFGR